MGASFRAGWGAGSGARGGREPHRCRACELAAAAANGSLQGILGFETRPLVSCDYTNDSRSVIIDGPSTMVVDGTQLKIYAWYDNEWGYSNRMADLVCYVVAHEQG